MGSAWTEMLERTTRGPESTMENRKGRNNSGEAIALGWQVFVLSGSQELDSFENGMRPAWGQLRGKKGPVGF